MRTAESRGWCGGGGSKVDPELNDDIHCSSKVRDSSSAMRTVLNKRINHDGDILYGEEDGPSADAVPKTAW